MLFTASRVLGQNIGERERLSLLERLQEKGLVPLIRSTRFGCYRQALSGFNGEGEMERLIAAVTEQEDKTSYCKGDLFCFDDHVLYLIFEDGEYQSAGVCAGIVYQSDTAEPLSKLDAFCRELSNLMIQPGSEMILDISGSQDFTNWQDVRPKEQEGFTRFVAQQEIDSLSTLRRKEIAFERVRAAELLEDDATRLFLRHIKEAYIEGHTSRLLATSASRPAAISVEKLVDAGLLRKDVLISCRQMGHILFSLPSPDALAVITVSNATCNGCGSAISDEKVEEIFVPTTLASALLEDGSWLANRLYAITRGLGIPGSEIAIAPPSGHGEAHMMVNVCGESFLLVLRDGELTPAFARRASDAAVAAEAAHLMIVVTGTIHDEGRLWLLNYARRCARSGKDFELKIAQGTGAAATELQCAFEQVSQKTIAAQLCELDDSLGLNIARVIFTRFQLLHQARAIKTLPRLALSPAPLTNLRTIEPVNHFTNLTPAGVAENVSGN